MSDLDTELLKIRSRLIDLTEGKFVNGVSVVGPNVNSVDMLLSMYHERVYGKDNSLAETIKALRKSSKLKAVQKMFENWSISNDEIKTITFDEFIEMESTKRTFENVASLNQEVSFNVDHDIYMIINEAWEKFKDDFVAKQSKRVI